jgi:membrane associated rhomboid family serine protease
MESHLVLDAAGISSEVAQRDGWWMLVVRREDLGIADAELEAYRQENPAGSTEERHEVAVYVGAARGVFVYAGILILIAILDAPWGFGLNLLPAGRMQAGQVMAGGWWRTVTALTLHADVGHLTANLVFGTLFGLLAGRTLGGGVAWLAIVIAGALGNLINAAVQAPEHNSIGASTAVFAALGVIVSHALRDWRADREKRLRRWSPLIGGVLLLAYTGVGGQRTDVVAHLTGFLSGLMIGWFGCRLPHHWLVSREVQKWAGYAAIALVACAWIFALAYAD